MELNSIDESVLVDRSNVRGALTQRLAVELTGSSDVVPGDCSERDKLDGVDPDLIGAGSLTAALLYPWPLPQSHRERNVSGQDVVCSTRG